MQETEVHIIAPFNSPVWSLQKPNESENDCRPQHAQITAPTVTAVLCVIFAKADEHGLRYTVCA